MAFHARFVQEKIEIKSNPILFDTHLFENDWKCRVENMCGNNKIWLSELINFFPFRSKNFQSNWTGSLLEFVFFYRIYIDLVYILNQMDLDCSDKRWRINILDVSVLQKEINRTDKFAHK